MESYNRPGLIEKVERADGSFILLYV